MNDSHTTSFIVDTPDYFAAHTDNNEIRLGLVNVASYQISNTHKAAAAVLSCKTSDEVEIIFDDFVDGVYGDFEYKI